VFFNEFATHVFGNETIFYTAYPNAAGEYEIPFLICMGLSFMFTMIVMILLSLADPRINPKAFDIDSSMFKVSRSTLALMVITLLILTALYVKFW